MIIREISKARAGRPILREVSLEIEPGTFWAVLGPTGAGKTTLLRILAGIERPDSGQVLYDGVNVERMPMSERSVAFVYQQFVNYPSLTVYENLASPLRVAKLPAAEIDRRVNGVALRLGLTGLLHRLPEQVSGGQQQRCAIGRALAKEARHVFLDEPLANLDFKLREELRADLKRLFESRAGVVVLATPDPLDAMTMATHVAFLEGGRILQQGPTRAVYRDPAHASVARYFSHPPMNLLRCEVNRDGGRMRCRISAGLEFEVRAAPADSARASYLLGIHPHHLSLERRHAGMVPFEARVELAEVVGSSTEVHLRHEEHRLSLLLPRVERFVPGQELRCHIDAGRALWFDAGTGARCGSVSGAGHGAN